MDNKAGWLTIGFLAQALFTMRFRVQGLNSERDGKSVIPLAFRYFSVAGGITLLADASHKLDPVFILGQAAGVFIYLCNLRLIMAAQRPTSDVRG